MIPHVFRNAAITAVVTSAAFGASSNREAIRSWFPTVEGHSLIAITDANSIPLNAPGIIERDMCLTMALARNAAYQCGDLEIGYQLPSVRVLGKTQAPALIYNSQHAHPMPLLNLDVATPSGITVPDRIVYRVKVNGTLRDSVTLTNAMLSTSSASRRRIQVGWDARNDATDVYNVVVVANSYYIGTATPYTDSISAEAIVINRVNSPVGAGWWIGGVEKILIPSNNTANRLWIAGDGSARIYRPTGTTGKWAADEFDRPDTLTDSSSFYQRRVKGGARVVFNAQGQHIKTIDPRGFETLFQYQTTSADAPLNYIYLPKLSTPYYFEYSIVGADTTIKRVNSPATSGTRRDSIAVYGNVIYQIFDPRGGDEYYEIDQSAGPNLGRIITRRERRGTLSTYAYDNHAQLVRAIFQVDSNRTGQSTMCPTFGLPVSGTPADSLCGNRVNLAPAAVVSVDGPRTDSLDVSAFRIARFGAVEFIKNARNDTTRIFRETGICGGYPAFVTKVVAFNGMTTTACPDARGNVANTTVYDGISPGSSQTTYYTWDATWDKPTQILDAYSVTFVASYDARGNIDSIGDSRTGSATRFFYGTGTGNDQYLLTVAKRPVTRTSATDYSYLTYDALGNPTGSYELTDSTGFTARYNAATHFTQDAIGRTTVTCVDIDSLSASTPPKTCHTTVFDIVGRDSVTTDCGSAYNSIAEQCATVRKFFNNETEVLALSREKSGDATPRYTKYAYDRAGHVTSDSGGASNGTTYSWYDLAGNIDSTKNRRGQVVKMKYDRLNRLAQKIVPQVVVDSTSPDSTIGRQGGGLGLKQPYPWKPNNSSLGYTMAAETFTYGYDAMGHMVLASNTDSHVLRGYTLNGLVKGDTLEIRAQSGSFKQYAVRNEYDVLNRRVSIHIPSALATSGASDSIRYNYVAVTSELDVVTDPLNNQWNYDYNLIGDVTHLQSPTGIDQYIKYDAVGNVVRDTVLGPSSTIVRASKFTYDKRNKRLTTLDTTAFRETGAFKYSALGYLIDSKISQVYNPDGTERRAYAGESMTYDALGNIVYRSSLDSLVTTSPFQLLDRHSLSGPEYLDSFWRISSVDIGGGVLRTYRYDADGNVFLYKEVPPDSGYQEDRYSYYDAEGRLRAADFRRGVNVSAKQADRVFEEYRYDALGRRVWVRTDKRCVGSGKPFQLCDLSTLRKTLWDGERELLEIQTPIKRAETATATDTLPSSDTDNDAYVAQWVRTSNAGDPNQFIGRVLYINGLALDQPLGVTRFNYSNSDDPARTDNFLTLGVSSISLLWDQKGVMTQAYCATGAVRCTGTRLYGGTSQERVDIYLPAFVIGRPVDNNLAWHGTLLVDKADATRTNYRRNRYYDPSSGRFTQADPIGLAGGLNLYGFANGDPLNFSDPFGLCCSAAESAAVFNDLANRRSSINHAVAAFLPSALFEVAVGAIAEGVGGIVAARRAMGIPRMLARVIPGNVETSTLGSADAIDVFVTDASSLRGLNSTQIAQKITIPRSASGFKVIEFPSSGIDGIASPFNRTNEGFINGGFSRGGAREFVIPNGPIPSNATIRIVP